MSLLRRIGGLFVAAQGRTYDRIVHGPAVIPRRRGVVALIVGGQAIAGALATLYLWLWTRGAGVGPFPWVATAVVVAAMVGATAAASWRMLGPMASVRRALAAGTAADDLPAADVRAAVRQHGPMAWATLVVWLVGGPLLGLTLAPLVGLGWRLASITAVVTLLFGSVMPVLVRYDLLVRTGFPMTAALLPCGRLDGLGDVAFTRVYSHIWLLLVLLGVVLPITLLLLAADPYVSGWMLALVLADLVVVGVHVGRATLRVISLPVGYLESRMRQVRTGDLDVRGRLFSVDTFGSLTSDFNAMVEGLRQREQIRDTFGRYVTRQVAEEILSGRVALGGERRVATVMFADIRGFTALAEAMPPEEIVALLNQYLGAMVRCVLDEGGVLDKFIGDAIMGLFGVPMSAGDPAADARAALRAAMAMSAELDRLNAARQASGLAPVEMGIGLHTGEVVAGNIGFPERMEYSVLGDAVNLSSRLEGLTRTLGHRVLLSEETASLVGDLVALERVDTVTVRGRLRPVTVFTTRR